MRSSGFCRCLAVHRAGLVALLAFTLLLGVSSVARAANFNWYWGSEHSEDCWQTGQLGSEGHACDFVFTNFLNGPGRMYDETSGVGLPSGDYCAAYGLGHQSNSQNGTDAGSVTGFTPGTPFSSYQEGDAYEDVCQAAGGEWGQEVRNVAPGNECEAVTCGMNHFVSLASQGANDKPWSSAFGEPSLVLSDEAGAHNFTHSGKSYGAWGYICAWLEEPAIHGKFEYCLQEWRSENDEKPYWEDEKIGECLPSGAMIQTYFYPGTSLATEMSGSANTFVVGSYGSGHFEAKITKTNLENAIKLANTEFVARKKKNSKGEEVEWSGHPIVGKGCNTGFPDTPTNYVLVGIEQGLEGWAGLNVLGGYGANLQLHTEYTPLPPGATTSAASGVQEEQATLNGSVNPKGTDTHYHFEYGETQSYGHIVTPASNDAGSGEAFVSATPQTITGLQPGMTYHYRIVATSTGGEVKGNDQTFTTSSAPAAIFDPSGDGNIYVATEGANHALYVTIYADGTWSAYQETAAESVYSAPSVSSDEKGDIFWTYEGREHKFEVLVRVPEKEGHPAKVEGPYQEAGTGSVYSMVSTSGDGKGHLFWTYEGPEHRLDVLVRDPEVGDVEAKVEGPYQLVGAGEKCAKPAEAASCTVQSEVSAVTDAEGHLFWTYEGPEHALDVLVRDPEVGDVEAKVEGPYQLVGAGEKCAKPAEAASCTTYSAVSASSDGKGQVFWTYEGAEHALDVLVRTERGGGAAEVEGPYQLVGAGEKCLPPAEAAFCSTYSAVSAGVDAAGDLYWSYQGPGNAFDLLVRNASGTEAKVEGPYQEVGAEEVYSAMATSALDAKGDFYWFYAGPKDTLVEIERLGNGEVTAVREIGGEGTTSLVS